MKLPPQQPGSNKSNPMRKRPNKRSLMINNMVYALREAGFDHIYGVPVREFFEGVIEENRIKIEVIP